MPRYVTMKLTLQVDLTASEIAESDLKQHIQDQVRITGHLHPEDPLFRAIQAVRINNFQIVPLKKKTNNANRVRRDTGKTNDKR